MLLSLLAHKGPADDGKRFAALGVAWPYCLYKGEGFGEGWWPDWSWAGGRRIFREALNTAQACVLETFLRY